MRTQLAICSGILVALAVCGASLDRAAAISQSQTDRQSQTDTQANSAQTSSAAPDEPLAAASGEGAKFDFPAALQVMRQACSDCHADGADEGGFQLTTVSAEESLTDEFDLWHRIRERVADGSMPPSDAEPLAMDTRDTLSEWIETATLDCVCGEQPPVGPPVLRRLTRIEYANTIRDLMGVHFNAAAMLPEDGAGGEGFTNAAETLIISPVHAERYLDAATEAINYALSDDRSRKLLFSVRAGQDKPPLAAATENLRKFATRAFRRPILDGELDAYVELCSSELATGATPEEAAAQAMKGVLISPQFLFLTESAPTVSGVAERITDHELAQRLSYFLRATMPDDQLRKEADAGRLHNPEVLREQVIRMIGQQGTHLRDSMTEFVGQWLGTADLGVSRHVDRQKHPHMTDPHVAGLRNQPVYYFEEVLKQNESLLKLIDSDWTFLNSELCRVYDIDRSKLDAKFVQNLVRVPLPESYANRGGLLAMGGVHAVASYPRRSSPVLRGTWVLERLLGVELPAPPPDVPALDDSEQAIQKQTLRQILEQHRNNAACATCHDRIDPIGFALENFDEIGRWRDRADGGPIDATAVTSDGQTIEGIAGLKSWLLQHRRRFLTQLTRKMLGYALGRSIRPTDLCTVRDVVDRLEAEDYQAQALILGIIESDLFQMKQ
jgi:mono/diheme cytochrome c family protein